MTKHWPERRVPAAPPALHHPGENHVPQLDSCRNVQRSSPSAGGVAAAARIFPDQLWLRRPAEMAPGLLEKGAPPHPSCPSPAEPHAQQPRVRRDAWSGAGQEKCGKKKNYQRYPKPPYSYLAMIAMVIQRSPDKKLTLSEILKEISTLFPFFKGNYKGWRDSVRHNLSSYDCFVKVLKDPGKPQGKGNFWSVDLSRVPLELLKRQNTAVSRQDETIFAQDLAPYILQGHKPGAEPPAESVTCLQPLPSVDSTASQEDMFRPKLDSSFAIDSLLHSLRPSSASGDAAGRDCWGEGGNPQAPSPSSLRARNVSSARSASASSASPASTSSASSDEDWRAAAPPGKRVPFGRAAGSNDCDTNRPPAHKSARREALAPPWELPTSYAKYAPPNAVAPPSMRFSGGHLLPLHGGLPLYSYGGPAVTPGHFLGHTYWPILPSRQVSVQPPPLLMDLDNMLQTVPPNKSVFDALLPTGPNSFPHHQAQSQYTLQNGAPLNRYQQF